MGRSPITCDVPLVDQGGVLRVLEQIEMLPPKATGIVRFGERGSVLVDSRVICWATATGMQERLSDLLRMQRNPPLERSFLARVFNQCRAEGIPLGEGLLSTGKITEQGLRFALFSQVLGAVSRIASQGLPRVSFSPLADARYDARFLFHPVDVLAGLGGRRNRALAVVAQRHLEVIALPDVPALAFLCEEDASSPSLLAVRQGGELRLFEAVEAGVRGSRALGEREPGGAWRVLVQPLDSARKVLCWSLKDLCCVAVCRSDRAAATVEHLEARLDELTREAS